MTTNFADEKCAENIKLDNDCDDNDGDNDEEEALSLCDLPINENQSIKEAARPIEAAQDFDFGSSRCYGLAESQMCAADEVFFQGQILPLRRHSVSSDTGLARLWSDSRNPSRSISRSESMDHCYSVGLTDFSSRSSSIRSHHSSSSGSSTSTRYKPRIRNQFHSHPSPTPRIRISNPRQGNVNHRNQKSTVWSFFQVGLVRGPEIILPDLKGLRNNNMSKNFGRNSSTTSSTGSTTINREKKKQRFLDRNGALFGGCKCSVNAVKTAIPSRIVAVNSSVSVKEEREETATKKKTEKRRGKQAASRHRTFEWLKQLSLEGGPREA